MTGGEPEVLAPRVVNESGGWVLQDETVTNCSKPANQPISLQQTDPLISYPSLLLVGASVRWAAQSAKKAGFHVIGMDLFGDTDTLSACDVFYRISPEVAAKTERLQQKIEAIADLHQARPWLVGGLSAFSDGSSDESLNEKSAPASLKRLCDGLTISIPPTLIKIPAADSSLKQTAEDVGSTAFASRRWLLKQHQSCGGLGVRFWDSRDTQSRHAIESGRAHLQQFISGHRYGLVAIANTETTHLLGMTRSLRQRIGGRPFVYSGSVGPCWDPSFPIEAMTELSRRIALEYSVRGLFNLDFVHDREGQWWLLELNARPSGSCEVIERSAWQSGKLRPSKSLMSLHVEAVDGKPIELDGLGSFAPNSSTSLYLKQIVYARREGRFHTPDVLEGIADVPCDQTQIQAGHPIATLIGSLDADRETLLKTMRANQRHLHAMVKPSERPNQR